MADRLMSHAALHGRNAKAETGFRNIALANFMKSFGKMDDDVASVRLVSCAGRYGKFTNRHCLAIRHQVVEYPKQRRQKMIVGMNHFTVTAEDETQTLDFYCGLLGLRVGPRPDLGFPGAWLYGSGPQAVLHMYFGRPMPVLRTGVIDHMAFSAEGLSAVKARFDKRSWKYDLRQQTGSGTWQLFCHDPNGARVELDFDPAETLE